MTLREILYKHLGTPETDEHAFDDAEKDIRTWVHSRVPKKKRKNVYMEIKGKWLEVCSCAFKAYNQAIEETHKGIDKW